MTDTSWTNLVDRVRRRDQRALAKLLTLLERQGPKLLFKEPALVHPKQTAFRIGITGPPGAGKSTLISRLLNDWLAAGLRVAVLAVDPSSPFTQGAILGDRIRYNEHVLNPNVFIRSLGTRGAVGGLSAASWLMVRAFDLAEYDLVLLETVGVGQTELEIMNVADEVIVVLTPESGDGIQGMKAGLLEIATQFVVNKSDRPGAEFFLRELKASLDLGQALSTSAEKLGLEVQDEQDEYQVQGPSADRDPLLISAASGSGVAELSARLNQWRCAGQFDFRRREVGRLRAEARALLLAQFELELGQRLAAVRSESDLVHLFTAQ